MDVCANTTSESLPRRLAEPCGDHAQTGRQGTSIRFLSALAALVNHPPEMMERCICGPTNKLSSDEES